MTYERQTSDRLLHRLGHCSLLCPDSPEESPSPRSGLELYDPVTVTQITEKEAVLYSEDNGQDLEVV